MRYVYNAKKRILRDALYYNKGNGIQTHRPVHLENIEGKLLMLLSDGKLHKYEDICSFLWKLEIVTCRTVKGKHRILDRKTALNRIRTTSCRMLKKVKLFDLRLECKRDIGIKLISKEKIWIE